MSKIVEQISIISEGCASKIWCLAWNPKGNLLASCGDDKTIQIWKEESTNKWVMVAKLEAHEKTVRRIAWSPDGNLIAAASFDASTSIWEWDESMAEFNHISTLEGHSYEVKSAAWDSTGTLLATCSRDKSIWIWQMEEDREFECLSISNGHSQDIKCVLWHPSEELLASGSYDDTIKMWRDTDGDWECVNTLEGHQSTVWDIAFNRDGTRLVSCSDDKSIIIWRHDKPSDRWCKDIQFNQAHSRPIYTVDWSHSSEDDGMIASGASDDSIVIYCKNNQSGGEYQLDCTKHNAHTSDINCVRWCPTRPNILASCGDDSTIRIWSISNK